jgi:hypothetical protein
VDHNAVYEICGNVYKILESFVQIRMAFLSHYGKSSVKNGNSDKLAGTI